MLQGAIKESYEGVQPMIKKIVTKFYKSYRHSTPIDYDELMSWANIHFMYAYATYDPEKAKFTTWVWNVIDQKLGRDLKRQVVAHEGHLKWVRLTNPATSYKEKTFNFTDFLSGLSEDAKLVAELVVEFPIDLANMLGYHDRTKHRVWWALKRLLKERGWEKERIEETYQEIQEALV